MSNPLTVIAIFAGITEVIGTAVLPFVEESGQCILIWFVVGFPVLLVVLFFMTLNFNHRVLYAPSDYREDSSFLAASSIRNSPLTVEQGETASIRLKDANEESEQR